EVGSGVDDLPHLAIDGLQFLFAHLCGKQSIAHLLDRVLIVTYLIDFLASAILRRVRHRMSAVAVGLHFQNVGSLGGSAPCDGFVASRFLCEGVHAIVMLAGYVVHSSSI